MVKIALIGNPNSGKSTLFNALTTSYQKTGNWTGVTVSEKVGEYKKDKTVQIVDLPGLYSFDTNSVDEKIVKDYLSKNQIDAIINVVDGTNLERNLYLTCELSNLNIPIVIAVNMFDQLEKNNIKLDVKKLEQILNVSIVPISAVKRKNLDLLIKNALTTKKRLKQPNLTFFKGNSIVEQRYKFIESVINKVLISKQTKAQIITEKIDKVILNKFLCLPIFFCVLTLIYYLSIKIGGSFGELVLIAFNNLKYATKMNFALLGINKVFTTFITDAVIGGFGAIFSLLPQILVLFILLGVLELSGYASRIAFLFDKLFYKFGLSGKSIIPMFVACGCTVSGINATRTIEGDRERRSTIYLCPFMPCGAKMAVFGYFSYTVFNGSAIIATSMYLISIICTVVFGLILNKFKFLGKNEGEFILEMPLLRLPLLKDIFYIVLEKLKDFIIKVGSTVIILSIVIWVLKNFGITGYVNQEVEKSFLYLIGNGIKYLFYPLGFGNWQASVSVICGIFAKEGIVETLHIICEEPSILFNSYYSAYAFLCFVLLSPPCVASLITAKNELKNKKLFYYMIIFQFISAYIVALVINLVGILIELSIGLLLFFITAIILIISLMTFRSQIKVKNAKKTKNNVRFNA